MESHFSNVLTRQAWLPQSLNRVRINVDDCCIKINVDEKLKTHLKYPMIARLGYIHCEHGLFMRS